MSYIFSIFSNAAVGEAALAARTTLIGVLTSMPAIITYFVVVLVIVAALIITIMVQGSKEPKVEYKIVSDQTANASGKSEEKEQESGERFCMLSEIDRNSTSYGHYSYVKGVDLESFCEDFRNYAASRLKLYYEIDDIRRFVAGLAVSKLVILQGMSGTGKTSLAHAFGSFIDNSSTVIPVQPMWKERTDLVGYYNEFTKRFNETLLLEKMYEANYSKDMYITVLDERNIILLNSCLYWSFPIPTRDI